MHMSETIEDVYALSPMQEGMLFHTLRDGGSGTYVERFRCRLRGPLDASAFAAAWRTVVARHDVLRTAFAWEEVEHPVQIVFNHADVPLVVESWHGTERGDALSRLDAAGDAGFDLARAPLFRVRLHAIDRDDHLFAFAYHHLLLDGW